MSQQFLSHLRASQQRMKIYEDEVLQGMARSLMPVERFETSAGGKDQRDRILLELLSWFKTDFFRWFDQPNCSKCDIPTEHSGMLTPTREEQFYGAGRVEGYRCASCLEVYRFPRYNHPEKLLQTREGRCGEWANCFALCCRALGYDTRYVEDNADHVWTEVYSEQQHRWLHCDSCENACDKPLTYESGWGKTYAYVMAFSLDHIADVTWRYTRDHKVVLSRRNKLPEGELARWIVTENGRLQSHLSPQRRLELDRRTIAELVELISPRRVLKEGETEGRASGSVEWRKGRGELGDLPCTTSDEFTFKPTAAESERKTMDISYSVVSDKWYRHDGDSLVQFSPGWKSTVFSSDRVFRKVEADWKMAYLTRVEGAERGEISWKVQCGGEMKLKRIRLQLISKVYENGNVLVTLCSNNGQLSTRYKTDDSEQVFDDFAGLDEVTITAKLTGGNSCVAWQQAQLFRASLNDPSQKQFHLVVEFQ